MSSFAKTLALFSTALMAFAAPATAMADVVQNQSLLKESSNYRHTTKNSFTPFRPAGLPEVVPPKKKPKNWKAPKALTEEASSLDSLWSLTDAYIDRNKTLSSNGRIELEAALNSLRGHVLYPILLAKATAQYPEVFDFNSNYSVFKNFRGFSFTQAALAAYLTKQVQLTNYNQVLAVARNYGYGNITTSAAKCAINQAFQHTQYQPIVYTNDGSSRPAEPYNLLASIVGLSTIPEACVEYLGDYQIYHTISAQDEQAINQAIVKQVGKTNNLRALAPVAVRSSEQLLTYAQTRTSSPESALFGRVNKALYTDIDNYALNKWAASQRYKNLGDVEEFYQNLSSYGLSAEQVKLVKQRYLAYNFNRIPEPEIYYKDLGDDQLETIVRRKLRDKEPYMSYLNQMSRLRQSVSEWQYWKARYYENLGQGDKAKEIYNKLIHVRTWYGLISAQRLGKDYVYAYENTKPLDRAFPLDRELPWVAAALEKSFKLNDTRTMSTVWNNLAITDQKSTALIAWAYDNHYYGLGVTQSIRQKLSDHLRARFPNAYSAQFSNEINRNGYSVPKTFAQAIGRQESAWNPKATSRAPAYGLMQFINSTARTTANKAGLPYSKPTDLYDAEFAIKLGTFHLNELFEANEQNRALVAIGYNAGPARIRQWLEYADGRLDYDEFVASIPFNETRGYVQNTTTFAYFHQVLQGVRKPVKILSSEWNRKY